MTVSKNMTQEDLNIYIANNTAPADAIPPVHVDDDFQLPPISSSSSNNCLCFKNSSAVSRNLRLFQSKYTSIQFYVKTCVMPRCYGTILSYSAGDTFGIMHQGTIRIAHGEDQIDTGLSLSQKTWNMVTIVIDPRKQALYVYLYDGTGQPQSRYNNP
jgi:hypothetical protein